MSDEVDQMDDVAGVCIYKGLVPHFLGIVSNLDNVRKDEGAILLRDELELCRVSVVCTGELALGFRDRIVGRNGRNVGRHLD